MIYVSIFCITALLLIVVNQVYTFYKTNGLIETVIMFTTVLSVACALVFIGDKLKIPAIFIAGISILVIARIIKRVMKRIKDDNVR